ncbi:DUF2500 domain-containing protein [Caproiciproducens sp. NJN-50]|uniref:DUF2500 domain-containing protein n=1 Tax=Acutalibacteraceae TaxID=3082771 RepID=UPI000FFE003D|nr:MULTISPECIES: DUF2500 domain-containing protein [Acutalibacteraceae]QAT49323.1 DUF2500 domain-containing protein [Caproiciproducens sp. NJN-50]
MGFSSFDGGISGIMFNIVPIMVVAGFVIVFGLIIVKSAQGAKQWRKNNQSPVLTVDAAVVTKRMDVRNFDQSGANDHLQRMSSTAYYVTFEVASGDRMEFRVRDAEYGMLVEQDAGKLTFQGTRYLGFERDKT